MEICNNCKITKQNPRGEGNFARHYVINVEVKFVQGAGQNLKKQ